MAGLIVSMLGKFGLWFSVQAQAPGTEHGECQQAARHGEILHEHDLLHLVCTRVEDQAGNDTESRQQECHQTGLEAEQQR